MAKIAGKDRGPSRPVPGDLIGRFDLKHRRAFYVRNPDGGVMQNRDTATIGGGILEPPPHCSVSCFDVTANVDYPVVIHNGNYRANR